VTSVTTTRVTHGTYVLMMWQVTGQTRGHCVDQSAIDAWHVFGKWRGAMWPSHGLPRGTHLLAHLVFGKMLDSMRFEPATSVWMNDLARSG
jgi:hypothetical protein